MNKLAKFLTNLVCSFQGRNPIPELDIFDVESLELLLDVSEDGVKPRVNVIKLFLFFRH